jgi:acetyl-CoA carboxylase biotin carboxylase subunit
MFERVLIANRGEIAVRIERTCRDLGIATHAVYSDADQTALHVRLADGATGIGPPPVAESYLNISAILDAAVANHCDAIHPGYGLLSENPEFARACGERGITFIGPSAEHIDLMGHKNQARAEMIKLDFPVIPGTSGDLDDDRLDALAAEVGYPLLVKASRGGGGIGMAIVDDPEKLARAVKRARSTARRSFGSEELYLEKQIHSAHHVEVQVFGLPDGTVRHLGERECSVQRRHQKVIEEAPAPVATPELRMELGQRAVESMERLGYRNAGTVECLLGDDGQYYFIEMNTRLQVEHPVTEMVTGLDLVELQLRIAAGENLDLPTDAHKPTGHSIEARIYAEDSETLMPAPGTITLFAVPSGDGIRIDTGVESGDEISPFYDPLIAKLIVWADDRAAAVQKLADALDTLELRGIRSNVAFLRRIVAAPEFRDGLYDTDFIDQFMH